MITNKQVINHMCKSARAMGLSKNKWLKIEDHLSKILESSGPEFTKSYLSDIREAKIKQMTGQDFSDELKWHKKNSKGEPADWQAHLWKFSKPKTSIQITSTLINCIELAEPTDKQIEKWESGVRCEKTNHPNSIQMKLDLRHTEYQLAKEIATQSIFSLNDITGTSIPGFNSVLNVSPTPPHLKKTPAIQLKKDVKRIIQAYATSINSAPALAGHLELMNISYVKKNFPDMEIVDEEERVNLAEYVKANGENLVVEYYDEEPSSLRTPRLFGMERCGHLAFLQQPGGKLRTIANPNRYLQHTMRPLQKVLSSINYDTSVSVLNQEEGLEWAQRKLREGYTLCSFDLSSATDTLDAQGFIDNYVQSGPLLTENLDSFMCASHSYWYSPIHGQDVNWNVGQPLGLAPSFSLLTSMNTLAGKDAAYRSNQDLDDSFRCVGDDFVCIQEIAPCYLENISSLNGIINLDKTMTSNNYAEFCSHIVTKHSKWPIKPKIKGVSEAYFIDAEKTSINKLNDAIFVPQSFKGIAETLGPWSSEDLSHLPSIKSSQILPFDDRRAANALLDMVSSLEEALPDNRTVSIGPVMEVVRQEALSVSNSSGELRDLSYSSESIIDKIGGPSVKMELDLSVRRYDWRKDSYLQSVSSITQAKRLAKTLQEIEEGKIKDDDALIMSITYPSDANFTAEILFDMETKESYLYLNLTDQVKDINRERLHDIIHKELVSNIPDPPARPRSTPAFQKSWESINDDIVNSIASDYAAGKLDLSTKSSPKNEKRRQKDIGPTI